jgi:hypothetical protein
MELPLAQPQLVNGLIQEYPWVMHRKNAPDHVARIPHALCTEKNPGKIDQDKGYCYLQEAMAKTLFLYPQQLAQLLPAGRQHAANHLE